jgi:hypothetical protein
VSLVVAWRISQHQGMLHNTIDMSIQLTVTGGVTGIV